MVRDRPRADQDPQFGKSHPHSRHADLQYRPSPDLDTLAPQSSKPDGLAIFSWQLEVC